MRLIMARIVILGLVLLHGLSVVAKDSEMKLALGTPRAEVIEALGEPMGKASDGRDEILFYGGGQEIHLRDGAVTMVTGSEGLVMKRAPGTVGTTTAKRSEPAPRPASSSSQSSRSRPSVEGMPPIDVGGFTIDENMANDFLEFQSSEMPVWAVGALAVFSFLMMFLMLVSMWRIFDKAGHPGWTSLVPIYNAYVMLEVAGKPGWWLLLMVVPVANFVVAVMVAFGVAEMFGKGWGFGLGIMFFPWIFYPILAFGSAQHGTAM